MSEEKHPAEETVRNAVEALVGGSGRIRERLSDAAGYIGEVAHDQMRGRSEHDLDLRIKAGLVEGGDDEDDENAADAAYGDVAAAIAMLDESRATEIAVDIFRLYELVARGDRMLVKHDEQDRPAWKFGDLAQHYAAVATQDLEPMIREVAQAVDADQATTEVLQMNLMRAWAAGASAASRDETIAEEARKFGDLVQGYTAVAAQDLEPIIRGAVETIDVDEAAIEVLGMNVMRAWAAGASAASRDAAIAKAARLAQVVKSILPEGDE